MLLKILDFFKLEEECDREEFADVTFDSFHPNDRIWSNKYCPDLVYTRRLQTAYQTAIERIDELEHELARSANSTYLEEAQAVVGLHRTDLLRIAELEAENEKLTVLYGFYKSRMLELDSKITARQESKEVNGEIHSVKKENKFASSDGISKTDKMKLATCYNLVGWTHADIAERLNVKASTIKAYLATANNHYDINDLCGGKFIKWDEEYGSDMWDLSRFAPTTTDSTCAIAV